MPLSIVEICNSALSKIGTGSILGLTDDSKEARACALRFDPCRRIVLRMHPWHCAIIRTILAPLSSANNPWGPVNIFPFPTDCLRVLAIGDDVGYRVEGRNLVSNATAIKFKYVSNLQDVTQMDELLAEAIACYLAWDICYGITQSIQARDIAWKSFELIKRQAKSVDSQEERDHAITATLFTDSRINRVTDAFEANDGED